jgi:hypothetical protein
MLRKVKLIPAVSPTSIYTRHCKMYNATLGDIMCWRDNHRACKSDCAAWYRIGNKVTCTVMPHLGHQEIAIVAKEKEEKIPSPPKPPPKRIIKEGVKIVKEGVDIKC